MYMNGRNALHVDIQLCFNPLSYYLILCTQTPT